MQIYKIYMIYTVYMLLFNILGVPLKGRAFRSKSSHGCGLSPAIPNVGERAFTVLHLHLGARAVPSRRPFPTIPAGCMAEAGHRGGRTNGTRPCHHTG